MLNAREYHVEDLLRDGTPIVIRAMAPDDRERVRTAFGGMERETRYLRFHGYKDEFSDNELKKATALDFEREVALLVTLVKNKEEVAIGGCRYAVSAGPDEDRVAEIAFTISEEYQGQGLATRLLEHLTAIARSKGVLRFEAYVLPQNTAMLRVFAKSGLPMKQHQCGEVVRVTLELA